MRLLPLIFIIVMLSSVAAIDSQVVNIRYQLTVSSFPNDRVEIQQGHPCKFAGRSLENITGFFKYKWDAKYRDLRDSAVLTWVAYHSLENENVTIVRIFASHMQRKLAVVSATKAPAFNGQTFPSLHCIVPIQSQLVKTYTEDELSEILGQGDKDI